MDAFLWQLAANAMLLNLKKEYDPHEDAMLEDILVKFYWVVRKKFNLAKIEKKSTF